MTITAAADGSALGNPGPTGWAWFIDEHNWAAGGASHGTNNIGELTAVLELLRATKAAGFASEELVVLCDSQYVINSVSKWMPGWKRKGWKKADGSPVLNVDLMKALDAEKAGRNVRFEWVKGHAGHQLNEAADARARAAATAFQRGASPSSGPGLTMGQPARAQGAKGVEMRGRRQEHAGDSSAAGAAGTTVPEENPAPPADLFSGFDELRARRERRERAGFSDPCATALGAEAAERALWSPDPARAAGEPMEPGVGRREAVLADGVLLVDDNGATLSPREWARNLTFLAQGGNGGIPASVGHVDDIEVGPDLFFVDAEVTAAGRAWRVNSLWRTQNGGAELLFHRIGSAL